MFKILEVFNSLKALLAGKKTYALTFLPAACIVAEKVFGWDVPYFVSPDNWKEVLWGLMGLASLRAGVTKVQNFNK